MRSSTLAVRLAAVGMFAFGAQAASAETLTVWFTKGFYPAEDSALDTMIARFEKKTGVKVELSKYAVQDVMPKTVAALEAGNVPDFSFGMTYDFQATGKWAREGKLIDVSEIMEPAKGRFLNNTLSTTLLAGPDGKKRYYAFPVYQQTMHFNYWKDMLSGAGFKAADIPKDWKGFWDFWCDKVQPAARKATGKRVYGIGNPMGVDGTDSFYSFHQFMLAYNVQVVDENGKITVDQPKNKAGLVSALKDYTGLLTRGCTPPSSTSWKDPDNNVNFHNKTTVGTHNATISIPAKWLDDQNNAALTADQRAGAKKNYDELIATIKWPNKPDGKPMNYLAAIKTAVIFKGAKNEKRAKEFMPFMMEDASLTPFTEDALGRWYPTTKFGADREVWVSGQDPHRKMVSEQFRAGTGVFPFIYNYRFTELNNENVWAKAMSRIVTEKVAPEKAADELIARIKEVAGRL